MKMILLQDVKSVGKKGDLINVSEGYAKNFLLPKKLAVEATKSNLNDYELKQKADARHKQEELEKAQATAKALEDKVVTIKVKQAATANCSAPLQIRKLPKKSSNRQSWILIKRKYPSATLSKCWAKEQQ